MDSTQAKQIVRTLIADMERLHVSKLKTALDDARCARDLSPGKMESTDEIRQRIKSLFINSATKILTTRDKAEWPGAIDALKDKINYSHLI